MITPSEFLAQVDNYQNRVCPKQSNCTDNNVQSSEFDLPDVLKQYLECFILLYDDSCNIFSQPCKEVKEILTQHHEIFSALLTFFFRWHFYPVPCEYIPPFDELISADCGACLVVPMSGNLRELYVSNINVYDYELLYQGYRNRPLCFHPNFSLEVLDLAGNNPHGYAELYRIFHFDVRGLENLKIFNVSENAIDVLYSNISTNFPHLQILDASHNKIALSLSGQDSFLHKMRSIEYIDLSYNEIRLVAEDKLSRLHNLQYLDISHNNIDEFKVNFSNLIRLEHLDLGNNELTSIPRVTFSKLNDIAMWNRSRTFEYQSSV